MAEMLLQSHTGYIAPLPALPDAWKDGQVSGLVARGNFEVSMKWKEKNLETLSFLSNVGGDLVVDYPNIEASLVKVNGKESTSYRIKDSRINAQRVMSLPLKLPWSYYSSDCPTKDSTYC